MTMQTFSSSDILRIAMKRKFHLLVIVAAGLLLGFVFSGEWFIKPKYKSSAVLYPSNLIPYSMETPTEQLLQLFQSADVRTMMINEFKLPQHYGIDTASKASKTRLFLAYDENVRIRKTEFESVKIDVLDEDPAIACRMVDSLIYFVDLKARMLQREKTSEVVIIFAKQLAVKKTQMDSLESILKTLRVRYGLLDYKAQSKEVTKTYLKLVGGGSRDKLREVDSLSRNLEEKGGDFVTTTELLDKVRNDYAAIKSDYDKAQSDMVKELTYSNVVTKPYAADTKSYPVRWIIMLTFGGTALLLALILFVLLDKSKSDAEPKSGTHVG